jgi:acid stress-induced BolA-like protein IbaG/YrbA
MLPADDIKRLIEQGLPGSPVIVQGDDGVHFEAVVSSPTFAGQSLLQQHRMAGDSA